MKPEVNEILTGLLGAVITDIAPHLPEGYPQGSMSLVALLMMFSAQEYDRAAEVRFNENLAMRGLFVDAARDVPDPDLQRRLLKAGNESDESLLISALNASNCELKELLVELHLATEMNDTPWAHNTDELIWAMLEEFTAARKLDLPAF